MLLELATPVRMVVTAEVDEVVAPGSEGYFGVLPGHAAFLTTLGSGEVSYRTGQREHYLAVAGGFAEVRADHIIILAEHAERLWAGFKWLPTKLRTSRCPVVRAPRTADRPALKAQPAPTDPQPSAA